MSSVYPSRFGDLTRWARENHISVPQARIRLGQYTVLAALALNQELSSYIVMKGGNALDFVWNPNRSTRDLDFSLNTQLRPGIPTEAELGQKIKIGFRSAEQLTGVRLHLNKIDHNPKGADKSFVTFEARIAYAMPGEETQIRKFDSGLPGANVVPVEISVNEVICDFELIEFEPDVLLRVSTLEDIIAEKLRAILQQPIRKRGYRGQDVFDIAQLVRSGREVNRGNVARFLLLKASGRDVPVSKGAFRDPEIERRARLNYDAIQATARNSQIEFDEAFAELIAFVDTLSIPDA